LRQRRNGTAGATLAVLIAAGCANAPPAGHGLTTHGAEPRARAMQDPASAPASGPGALSLDLVREALASTWPADAQHYPTTAGEVYLHNLDARVAMLAARLHRQPSIADRERLAGALFHRYRLRGAMHDAERALELVDDPDHAFDSGEGLLLRSVVLAAFHRFAEAEQSLQQAGKRGAPAAELQRHRNDLWVAQGRYDLLRADLAQSAQPVADFHQLAHRADLRVLLGDLAGAERQYWAAQSLYRDVSPVPLAWLHTQMGIALLRFGEVERARRFFAVAVERLPGYYLAEEHLAECEARLGEIDAARERYRRVIASTGNPEFVAALAALEAGAGNQAEAAALQRRARDGYEAWLARHPAAAAQHVAEFFLDNGDAGRAHELAAHNFLLRSDVGSRLLLVRTADAIGEHALACEQLDVVRASGLEPPELEEVEAIATRCRG
jgi:tetratricopeptide (TPR) repeat protein